MADNLRHTVYVLLGIAATLLTWPHAFDWMRSGGNIFNAVQFFSDAIHAGGTAAFLSIDMAIAWIVYMIWVVTDAKRIGLGAKWGWFFLALSYVGVSLAFPVYIVTRERFLQRHDQTAESARATRHATP
jgi:hypothetical protein